MSFKLVLNHWYLGIFIYPRHHFKLLIFKQKTMNGTFQIVLMRKKRGDEKAEPAQDISAMQSKGMNVKTGPSV